MHPCHVRICQLPPAICHLSPFTCHLPTCQPTYHIQSQSTGSRRGGPEDGSELELGPALRPILSGLTLPTTDLQRLTVECHRFDHLSLHVGTDHLMGGTHSESEYPLALSGCVRHRGATPLPIPSTSCFRFRAHSAQPNHYRLFPAHRH